MVVKKADVDTIVSEIKEQFPDILILKGQHTIFPNHNNVKNYLQHSQRLIF